jgi:DNA-binding NtrC family response regulator
MMSGGRREIEVSDLPEDLRDDDPAPGVASSHVDIPPAGLDLNAHMVTIERDLIMQALARTNGNRNKGAELLRIKRTTLVEKMKRLGIE